MNSRCSALDSSASIIAAAWWRQLTARVAALFGTLLAALLAATGMFAQSAAEPAIELPPFVITETTGRDRPWRYAQADGFEIISQVADESTQQVFAALWRGPRLTLPEALRPRNAVPMAVVLFDQEPSRSDGLGALGSMRKATEQGSHWTNVIKRTLPDREVFCLNLRGSFFTYSSAFRFDLRTHLALHTPTAPPWLYEALYGAYGIYREGIEYRDRAKDTEVVRALWCNEDELIRAETLRGAATEHFLAPPEKRRAVAAALRNAVVSPGELWLGGLPPDRRPPAENARWAATCALFARWALYAENGRRHDAFWEFAAAACGQVVDEALFRRYLGLGYAEARDEIAWFLPIAVTEPADRSIAPLVPPKLVLRPATPGEVARVRGEWEYAEATVLAAAYPELAAKYRAKAGRTLRDGYAKSDGDPRLAELLGLYEFEAGNDARARELLEAATKLGPARPRAWSTLARLRFAALTSEAGRAPLTHAQALTVLLPLEEAWRQEPAQATTYELLAEVWRRCPELPSREASARLQEGARKFPRNSRVALAAIRACIERGQRADAIALLDHALDFTGDAALRERLEKTRAALQASPAPQSAP